MSSHHIIRDQQEPALLVHDFEKLPLTILHSLLEWSPTVVVCEPALMAYIGLGLKLDIALVELSSIDHWKAELANQHPVKIISTSEEEALATGLFILSKEQHQSVNILTNEEVLLELTQAQNDWLNVHDVIWIAKEGRYLYCKKEYTKWLPKGIKIVLFPIRQQVELILNGVGEENTFSLTERMSFTTIDDSQINIASESGSFLVMEPF